MKAERRICALLCIQTHIVCEQEPVLWLCVKIFTFWPSILTLSFAAPHVWFPDMFDEAMKAH